MEFDSGDHCALDDVVLYKSLSDSDLIVSDHVVLGRFLNLLCYSLYTGLWPILK